VELDQLTADLKNTDARVRATAAEQLAKLAEDAQPAAVQLVAAMGDADSTVHDWVYAALESLGPPRAEDASGLTQLVSDKRLDVAYWAVTLLGRLGAVAGLSSGDTAPVVSAITTALQGHAETAVRERAAWALGQIGAPAAAAIPALQQAASDPAPRLSRLAQEALEKIKPA
jgi:HEAT repeat protein